MRLVQPICRKWRRGQDSNLHDLSVGGFQDRCTTNYATPPRVAPRTITQAQELAQLCRAKPVVTKLGFCATSVSSVPLWLIDRRRNHHKGTEDTKVAQRLLFIPGF